MKSFPKTLIFFIFLFLAKISSAQNDFEKINFIKTHLGEINKHLKSYRKIEKKDTVETTEGNEIAAYFNGSNIKKITAIYYGETGKERDEYYFYNDQLIFYYSVSEHYKIPMNVTPNVVISSKVEERYYFNKDLVISYSSTARKKPTLMGLKQRGEEIIKETKRLRSLVR